jgi:hypothetical protein
VFKDFHITEGQAIGFRADFFNVFNIASYGNPDNGITDANFGQIANVRSPKADPVQRALSFLRIGLRKSLLLLDPCQPRTLVRESGFSNPRERFILQGSGFRACVRNRKHSPAGTSENHREHQAVAHKG